MLNLKALSDESSTIKRCIKGAITIKQSKPSLNRDKGLDLPAVALVRFIKVLNMPLRLSGHISIFGLVVFVLKFLLGVVGQWNHEKFAILTLKPRSHVRILTHRTWAIYNPLR